MTPLNNDQKELLFDYCMGLTREEETSQAEQLISSNQQASELYAKLKASVSPLDTLEPVECPDELVESTVFGLKNLARSSHAHLQDLLAAEQAQPATAKIGFWRMLPGRLATAAVFIIVGSVAITSFNIATNFARQHALQYQCQMQMAKIFGGINQYSTDHDGRLPSVAMSAGAPWWKVGSQSNENHSNTRHLWLLPKGGYVSAANFVCPERKLQFPVQFDNSQIKRFKDFPSRDYVTYSFRLMGNRPANLAMLGRSVLMSDLSPLFETLPCSECGPFNLKLTKDLAILNSVNHNRRGHNVLFTDGSIKFRKRRSVGLLKDDIFTLQHTSEYTGTEVPACETDTFLAP